ncbi:hypothetical protein SAMN04487894_105141 [Niabella drilacis]|uniref:Uncharacterized protein n=1 Tax=Niabella drilacis (strain DSM 25811 / CCM 8410 / CCUG 62505 / LMG 26954 / E90) TaxID=1285928 RepID=A0A1G6R4Y8_NIADE|nr:hypothetical protein SAMN04487894_105141 [Niabella drilacis]
MEPYGASGLCSLAGSHAKLRDAALTLASYSIPRVQASGSYSPQGFDPMNRACNAWFMTTIRVEPRRGSMQAGCKRTGSYAAGYPVITCFGCRTCNSGQTKAATPEPFAARCSLCRSVIRIRSVFTPDSRDSYFRILNISLRRRDQSLLNNAPYSGPFLWHRYFFRSLPGYISYHHIGFGPIYPLTGKRYAGCAFGQQGLTLNIQVSQYLIILVR